MNNKLTNGIVFLFTSILPSLCLGQLKAGDIVSIKNVKSSRYMMAQNPGDALPNMVVLFAPSNIPRCRWKVIIDPHSRPEKGELFYKFQNVSSQLFLTVNVAATALYGMLQQTASDYKEEAMWTLETTTTAFKLKNKKTGQFAAVQYGGVANNSRILQQPDNGQPDMLWQFETAGTAASVAEGRKVLLDVHLNYISVSEATRNRIDNGDCKRVFGQVITELWELDENNEMKKRLVAYNNQPEILFNEMSFQSAPTIALSNYQDNLSAANDNFAEKVTYNVPEILLQQKKLMLVVKTYLGTRHKDNDFASYDHLEMKRAVQSTYVLSAGRTRSEIISASTDLTASPDAMPSLHGIEGLIRVATDDIHKIWVKFSCKIN